MGDILGIWEVFKPKFVKRYANMAGESVEAIQDYIREVTEGKFPEEQHWYKMIEGEAEKMINLLKQE